MARHGCVDFEVAVAVQAWLAAGDERDGGRARGGIAADGEPLADGVSISEHGGDEGDDDGEVVVHVPDVLLGVDHFDKVCDAVTSNEAVVGEQVHAGAADSYISRGSAGLT